MGSFPGPLGNGKCLSESFKKDLKRVVMCALLLGSYKRRGQEHLTWGRCVICRQSTHQNMDREELFDLTLRQNRETEERGEE